MRIKQRFHIFPIMLPFFCRPVKKNFRKFYEKKSAKVLYKAPFVCYNVQSALKISVRR